MAEQPTSNGSSIILKGVCAMGSGEFPFKHRYETDLPVHVAAASVLAAGYSRLATTADKVVVQLGHSSTGGVDEACKAIRRIAGN